MQALYYRAEFGSTDWLSLLRTRWQMLLAVVLVHLLFIMLWPSLILHKSEHVTPLAMLVQMLEAPAPPQKTVPSEKTSAPDRPATAQDKRIAPVVNTKTVPQIEPPAADTVSEPVAPSIPSAREQAGETQREGQSDIQRDIRKLVKDVEREMPNRILTDIKPEKSSMLAFEKNVAAAARPRGTTMQNFVLPDGTAITKVTTSLGSYCVIGAKPGWDITKAPGIRTVSCGSY
ncbi:hypothetical protein ACO0LF_10870 [Undibacterium sp. Di27W]|uniref:hypothetical protein n=1 Tax=Undibacterium sp. Di27W TaxID=3413036 RepID=UPI003BF17FBD